MLLKDLVSVFPDHTLFDISVFEKNEGKCFGAIKKDLQKKVRLKKYLNFKVTYACPETTELSFACTKRSEKTCILIDLEEAE